MDAAIELRPGSLLGGFRIDSPIGRGGMGVVYRATQLSLERQVALKLISPELAQEKRFRERFLREARLAASLDHQHLLPVHEAGEAEGTLFLAMRLVEGASLAELLRREGRLAPERAVRLLAQVAEALEAAHAVGLLHRDVKPPNVLVAGAGKREHAYLCDFGLSRRLSGGSLTREGAFVGTAAYAAPEQIRGDQLDGGCDLYSLACLLYECLTGDPPFAREDELALLWAHLHEPPPAVSGVNPALAPFDAFFSRALAKDPGERYPSASALVEAALAAPGSEAAPAEGSRRPGPTARLPRPLTPFLGRERELQELLALLLEDETRLLTLTGPGGTGKTRLALRVAEEAAEAFPDGVFWVGLASLRDFALVTETIAQMLEAKDSLPERIGERKLLLLLDNFEQVVEAAPEFSPLLASCPSLALLVTSRELLRVQGEVEYAVPPLAEPEAVSLFCARSRLAPTEEITELCARLDNLPLAVELAAARAKVLSPTQILERLSQRLDLLKGGRDADPRQQTLRAAIEWSYDLLSEAERQLFARLSVFPGTFSLEAAEEVCDADLDTLATLVDKSLLRRGHDGRFFMLATIREYALERLDTGESETVGGRHAAVVSTLAGSEGPAYLAGVWGERLARLEPEQDNIRAALSWLFDHGADGAACRLCSSVWPLWYQLGNLEEARRALTRALAVSAGASHEVRAALYAGTALLAREAGELEKARALHEQQLELAAELGDEEIRAAGLELLGITLTYLGEFNEAASVLQECVDTFRHAGDQSRLGMALNDLGLALMELGDRSGAWAVFEEGLSFERSPENSVTLSFLLHSAGSLAAREGDSEKAKALLREGLALFLELGDKQGVADSLETLGTVAAGRHLAERAAVLWGAGGHLRDELGVEMQMSEREMHDAALDTVMRALGEDAFRSATHRGASMTSDEAVAFALSVG